MSDVFDSKAFLKTVTSQRRFIACMTLAVRVIYVGKAKDLRNASPAIFRNNLASRKTEALVAHQKY